MSSWRYENWRSVVFSELVRRLRKITLTAVRLRPCIHGRCSNSTENVCKTKLAGRRTRVCVLVHRGWDVVPGRHRRRASFAPFGAGEADVCTRAAVATHNSHTAFRHHLPSNAAAGGINSRTWRGGNGVGGGVVKTVETTAAASAVVLFPFISPPPNESSWWARGLEGGLAVLDRAATPFGHTLPLYTCTPSPSSPPRINPPLHHYTAVTAATVESLAPLLRALGVNENIMTVRGHFPSAAAEAMLEAAVPSIIHN